MKSEVLLELKTLFILFNLMYNADFGKTMENIRNHSSVKLITKWDGRYGAEALIARPEFRDAFCWLTI